MDTIEQRLDGACVKFVPQIEARQRDYITIQNTEDG